MASLLRLVGSGRVGQRLELGQCVHDVDVGVRHRGGGRYALCCARSCGVDRSQCVTLTSSGTVANPTKIICVNRAGSVPPVSADRLATAQVLTTGNTNITFAGCAHYDGIIFRAGNSTGTASINLTSTSVTLRFDNCSLRCGSTGAASKILIGGTSGGGVAAYVEFNNTTLSFAATT